MKKLMFAILLSCACCSLFGVQYSKRSLIRAVKQAGKWEQVKAWVKAADLWDEFQNSAFVSDEVPEYPSLTNMIVRAGLATTAEIEAVLAVSKDTAVPESNLLRVYNNDMSNSTGRVKWHGRPVSVSIDTNRLVKTTVYADGWVYERKFSSVEAMPIERRISLAERKAAQERRAKADAARKEKIRQERIAMLQTNMTAEVAALMAQKRWPEDLAKAWLRNELNTLVGTQTVTVTVGQ